jgi:DNA repair protein RecN (Recombination protein N)
MLTHLSISNILLLKRCEIDFTAGLNVLTGETGAGKSILLDALGLVLGERSDAGLVRQGEAQASVSAEFVMGDHSPLRVLLAELELDVENTLILRRSLNADGKSRAFANDSAITVGALKRIGELLVQRHGQHDQRGLLDAKTHRDLLDAYAGNEALRTKVAAAFAAWKQARDAYALLQLNIRGAAGEEEWLRHTARELEALGAEEGEEETLVTLRAQANAARQSIASLQAALDAIHAHGGLAPAMRQATRSLQKAKWDGGALESIITGLERAETELEEATVALEKLTESAEIDPAALERAEDRLHALRAAARKYNVAVTGLRGLLSESQRKLTLITSFDAQEKQLSTAVGIAQAAYEKAAKALSAARAKASGGLVKAVEAELAALKMVQTRLRMVQQPLPETSWGEAGNEQVIFEVATNAGQGFGALNKVASGGELSRLLLALKVVLRGADSSSAIFDEIDTGTGGAVAEAIGQRLRKLAQSTQVLVVTHLPQVAAQAAHHLFIAKAGTKQVETTVVVLDKKARSEELARMMSGATISDEARKAATKLLQAAS